METLYTELLFLLLFLNLKWNPNEVVEPLNVEDLTWGEYVEKTIVDT
jgi:hypothetical protein